MNLASSDNHFPTDAGPFYEQLLEVLPAGIALIDAQQPTLPIVYVNAAFEALNGISREEIVGRSATFLLGEPPDPSRLDEIRVALAGQIPTTRTVESRRKDGSRCWYELRIAPKQNPQGNVTHLVAVQNDVTPYRETEAGLNKNLERLKATIEIIPDLIFYHSADGTFQGYHAPSENMLAVPPEQFLGKKIEEVFPPQQAQLFSTAIAEAIETHQMRRLEYSLTTPDGVRDFEARYLPSGVDEFATIIRDITLLKQAERQALSLTLEKERTQMLREFVRNASHEFRTPLSMISSSAYLMARSDDPEKRRLRAEQIAASVSQTTYLVDMLLKMVTLDANLSERRPIDVAELMHYLRTEILSPANEARLQFEIPADLPPVWGYREQLLDALQQLVGNALRYTPDDGQITVRAYSEAASLIIEVEDTGIGISEEALPHIFETFWRQDDAHSTPGLGLGLSIAQKIVELHGGHIDVDSAVGRGSRFRIVLPD